jgi:phenylpropionate dioxygenase-like ring-hydroxylating dioxygenase large terminal subunit
MRSKMPPQAYIDQAWFDRERDLLFKPLWQFIGLKVMLEKHNSFITRTLFGIPIVVQNFRGELRAFENICPHRQNPIQIDPHGVRPLFCGYHGWSFDKEGETRIPHEDVLYRYPQEERACIHLRRFALEEVGNLLFVNLSEDPLPIKQQFGAAMIASMKASSETYDGEVIMTTYDAKFNWKLVYENLRDGNHPRYVHSRSLYQDVKFEAKMDEDGLAATRRLQQEEITDRARALALMRSLQLWRPRRAAGGAAQRSLAPVRRALPRPGLVLQLAALSRTCISPRPTAAIPSPSSTTFRSARAAPSSWSTS